MNDWVWSYAKHPLTLKGKAGTTTWKKVLFGAKTVDLRWKATAASKAGCTLRFKVESKALAKPLKVTRKVKGSKPASGTKALTIKYGDGVVTVSTDCASWSLKVVATSWPGITLKQSNDTFKTKATTAAGLNEALYDSEADPNWRYLYRYTTGAGARMTSVTATIKMVYELPAWKAPEGTSQGLVDQWQDAVAAMRTHLYGEAALQIQYVGRFLADAQKKTSFSSLAALQKYLDKVDDRHFDSYSDRFEAYNKSVDYGYDQGAWVN
jgi:hypothetical protein